MEKVNKRLLGVEDVNWDDTGMGESENFTGSDGSLKILRKINESHIPLSKALRELFPGSTYLSNVLVRLQEMASSLPGSGGDSPGAGGMASDKIVNISPSMSAAEIQLVVDEQEKNLGTHTLTLKFSENSYQTINQSIVFDGFYNGKIIIDGNGSTVTDTGNIGRLFLFDVCICYVEFQNFIVQLHSSAYGIEAKATSGIFVENCKMSGSENTFFVNAILSDAVFDDNCAFSGGAQRITGYVYDWVKENYFPVKGGEISGDLSVTGGISVSKSLTVSNNLTVKNKNVVLSVNNLTADSNNNITIDIKDIKDLQSALDGKLDLAGGTMTGTIKVPEQAIRATTDSGVIRIHGGTGADSAGIFLFGKGRNDQYAGQLYLSAQKGADFKYLILSPDGMATWDSKNIVRSVDGVNADAAGNVALNALKTSGGTMTGMLNFSADGASYIKKTKDNGSLVIRGGSDYGKGATIALYGKDSGANPGCITLSANNGTSIWDLMISPTGSATLGGKNIVRSVDGVNADAAGNVTLNALKTTGGTMTENLYFSAGAIAGSVNTHVMGMYGGVNYNNGGGFIAYGKDYSGSFGGVFVVSAHDGTTNKTLVGKPDGRLTWGGKDITLGYPNYAAGVDCGTVSSYTATADGWIFGVQRREDAYWNLRVNGTRAFSTGGSDFNAGTCLIPVKKGDVITTYNGWEDSDNTKAFSVHLIFYPNR